MTLTQIESIAARLPILARNHVAAACELHNEAQDIFRRARCGQAEKWEISRAYLLKRCARDELRVAQGYLPQRRRSRRRAQ